MKRLTKKPTLTSKSLHLSLRYHLKKSRWTEANIKAGDLPKQARGEDVTETKCAQDSKDYLTSIDLGHDIFAAVMWAAYVALSFDI